MSTVTVAFVLGIKSPPPANTHRDVVVFVLPPLPAVNVTVLVEPLDVMAVTALPVNTSLETFVLKPKLVCTWRTPPVPEDGEGVGINHHGYP